MKTFLALYRGEDIEHSELVAVSADRKLIRSFIEGMVEEEDQPRHNDSGPRKKEVAKAS